MKTRAVPTSKEDLFVLKRAYDSSYFSVPIVGITGRVLTLSYMTYFLGGTWLFYNGFLCGWTKGERPSGLARPASSFLIILGGVDIGNW